MATGTPPVIPVTLDTSAYVGALHSSGFGSRLFTLAYASRIRIDFTDAILDEVVHVLRDKFGWDGYRIVDACQRIAKLGNRVVPSRRLDAISEDPSDNRILECAVEAASEYILSWDKDLLRIVDFEGIRIMRPSEFLAQFHER